MPFYDYVYGTLDKSTDTLYDKSLERKDESPNVVHITHLTTPESIYHIRLGFASLASKPYTSPKWYLRMLWPVTISSMIITWIYGKTFVVERNMFKNLKIQTWAIPKYKIQVSRCIFVICIIFHDLFICFTSKMYIFLYNFFLLVFHGMAKKSDQWLD